jgi:hypothetical protein
MKPAGTGTGTATGTGTGNVGIKLSDLPLALTAAAGGQISDEFGACWDGRSRDAHLLKMRIANGEIKSWEQPKAVKDRYPEFKKYNTTTFRNGFRKLVSALNNNSAGEDNVDDDGDDGGKFFYLTFFKKGFHKFVFKFFTRG